MKRAFVIGFILVSFVVYFTVGAKFIVGNLAPSETRQQPLDAGPSKCKELSKKDQKLCSGACGKFAEDLKKKFDDLNAGILGQDPSQVPDRPARDEFEAAAKCQPK